MRPIPMHPRNQASGLHEGRVKEMSLACHLGSGLLFGKTAIRFVAPVLNELVDGLDGAPALAGTPGNSQVLK